MFESDIVIFNTTLNLLRFCKFKYLEYCLHKLTNGVFISTIQLQILSNRSVTSLTIIKLPKTIILRLSVGKEELRVDIE